MVSALLLDANQLTDVYQQQQILWLRERCLLLNLYLYFFQERIKLWNKIIWCSCSLTSLLHCSSLAPNIHHIRALVPQEMKAWLPPGFRYPLAIALPVPDYSFSPSCLSSSTPPTTNCPQLHPFLTYSLALVGNCFIMISDNLIHQFTTSINA